MAESAEAEAAEPSGRLRSSERYDSAWENPPTKKNTGMTWSSQVSGWSAGTTASRLPTPSGVTAAIIQCPSTTTASEPTRRRST